MKLLFLGGPLDGQLKDTDEKVSPLVPTTITATLPTGTVANYTVHFFAGNTLQFPLACYDGVTPDDIFKFLLQWYSVKPFVQQVPEVLPAIDSEPVDDSVIDVASERVAVDIETPADSGEVVEGTVEETAEVAEG